MTTRTAIRSYLVRRIQPDDRVLLCRFYAELSPDSRAERFHGATPPIADGTARAFCGPDHRHREGIVAVAIDDDGRSTIIGHVCVEPTAADEAEMAIAVADGWQRQGVGRAMLGEAIRWARAHQVARLRASVRWGNAAVIALLRSCGCPLAYGASDGGGVDVLVELAPAIVTAAA
jgi:acetyltransferase